MKNKQHTNDNFGEVKDNGGGFTLHKFDHDLYDETLDTIEVVIRVKRTYGPTRGEKWRVMMNDKVIFTVDGSKLSKKEREFLRSPEGVSFLIRHVKSGIKSFHGIKLELKKLHATKR